MRVLILALAAATASPPTDALAGECSSLVKSACEGGGGQDQATAGRRVITMNPRPPEYATGDRFPVEEHSLLMNPGRYKLPKVDGPWRYYAVDGVVYRVDSKTATVLQVISDERTWALR
ncbi:MAG: hypothetical protein HC844_08355 [Tabrizicola sp.]|nr:hypothetical protein [Tabrizicola sp.]